MEKINQSRIAEMAGVTPMCISYLLSGQRRPSWTLAKKLGKVTNTSPVLWLDGTPTQIKKRIRRTINFK